MTVVTHTWNRLDQDPALVDRLTSTLGCHRIAAAVLVNRGFTDVDSARRAYDAPIDNLCDPFTLRDMDRAAARLETAVIEGHTVSVYGDRDLDGVAGTAILTSLLQDLGTPVGYQVPGKWDGYGIHVDALETLADRGTDLVISVDCGIDAADEFAAVDSLDMEVIVTDHHPPDGPLPAVEACLNPRREDCPYPNDGLAGAGVAYKLGEALVDRHGTIDRSTYRDLALPLAGLATVADRAPITLENRSIVRAGFERFDRSPLVGLRRAARDCGLTSIRDFGWSLAPRLNGAREDPSGHLMLRAVVADEPALADGLLDELKSYQDDRRDQRREWLGVVEAAVDEQVDPDAEELLVIETDDYVGGAPGRIAERYGKPVLSFYPTDGGYRGQVDTATDLAIDDIVEACGDLLESTWGHPGAPRFLLPRGNRSAFIERFRQELHERHSPEELTPSIDIDAVVESADVTRELVRAIDTLRPFGDGFDEPIVAIEGVTLVDAQLFGEGDRHVSLRPDRAECRLVWWHGREALGGLDIPGRYDVAGALSWDDARDAVTVAIADVRDCSSPSG